MMLRKLKLATVHAANALGISYVLMNTKWRRQRLLILCYHGVSLDDEHLWNPGLYMPPEQVRARFTALKKWRANVIPLDQAISGLYSGQLPERSVVMTFDDGMYDFYAVAHPLLKEFGFPTTVYLTTYYSGFNRPVFDVMCSYLLWKGRARKLRWPEVLSGEVNLDEAGCEFASQRIKTFAREHCLSGQEKDGLLASLAGRLQVDYEALCRRRILHIMTPDEVSQIAAEGTDIQLHTHRHRVSAKRERFLQELHDNRSCISSKSSLRHFCYPGGFYLPQFVEWLRDDGILSSTTCEPGIASKKDNPLLLPRLVDHAGVTQAEFIAWLSGFGSFLPRRVREMSEGYLLD